MVVANRELPTSKQLADQLLTERSAIANFIVVVERLQSKIHDYETRYEIDSADVPAAIEDGRLTESSEVCDWLLDFELLQRAKAVGA